jgi:hypothetical protein
MPVSLTRKQGFPRMTERQNAPVFVDGYFAVGANFADFVAALPAIGGTTSDYGGVTLDTREITRAESGNRYDVTLTYRNPDVNEGGGGGSTRTEGETEYSLEDGGMQKSVETLANFKTCWKYHLAGKGTASVPVWGTTATTLVITGADSQTYEWLETPNAKRDGWNIIQKRTKAGQDEYIASAPVVVMTKYYSKYSDAEEECENFAPGTIDAPEKTFGLPSEDDHWLIVSMNCQRSGRYWAIQVRYQYADIWDIDFYP